MPYTAPYGRRSVVGCIGNILAEQCWECEVTEEFSVHIISQSNPKMVAVSFSTALKAAGSKHELRKGRTCPRHQNCVRRSHQLQEPMEVLRSLRRLCCRETRDQQEQRNIQPDSGHNAVDVRVLVLMIHSIH